MHSTPWGEASSTREGRPRAAGVFSRPCADRGAEGPSSTRLALGGRKLILGRNSFPWAHVGVARRDARRARQAGRDATRPETALRLGANMVCSNTLGGKPGLGGGPKRRVPTSNKGPGGRLQVLVAKRVMAKSIVGREFRVSCGRTSPFHAPRCAGRASKKAVLPATWRARRWPMTTAHFP